MRYVERLVARERTAVGLLGVLPYKEFILRHSARDALAFSDRVLRLCVMLVAFGLLAACANSDPLAVASGPVFQLNSGHWQPSKQAMAAVPVVAAD